MPKQQPPEARGSPGGTNAASGVASSRRGHHVVLPRSILRQEVFHETRGDLARTKLWIVHYF